MPKRKSKSALNTNYNGDEFKSENFNPRANYSHNDEADSLYTRKLAKDGKHKKLSKELAQYREVKSASYYVYKGAEGDLYDPVDSESWAKEDYTVQSDAIYNSFWEEPHDKKFKSVWTFHLLAGFSGINERTPLPKTEKTLNRILRKDWSKSSIEDCRKAQSSLYISSTPYWNGICDSIIINRKRLGAKAGISLVEEYRPGIDKLYIHTDTYGISDISKKPLTISSTRSNKELIKKSRSEDTFVYDTNRGLLFFNANGTEKNWGKDGGITAMFSDKTRYKNRHSKPFKTWVPMTPIETEDVKFVSFLGHYPLSVDYTYESIISTF